MTSFTATRTSERKQKIEQKELDGYCKTLDRDGFVLIPEVLNKNEVALLREYFQEKFADPEKNFEGNDYFEAMFELFERFEELSWLLWREPMYNIARQILGENFVLMRGTAVHHKRYGWWWHKDTSNEERAGHTYHLDPAYRQLIAVFYLQDNTRKYGGGLDVEIGSHLKRDPGFQAPRNVEEDDPLWRKLLNKPKADKKWVPDYNDHLIKRPYTVPSKAGDLIIFDVKINHRATQKSVDEVPAEHEKLAIFTHFARNNHTVKLSTEYLNDSFEKSMTSRTYPRSVQLRAEQEGMFLA